MRKLCKSYHSSNDLPKMLYTSVQVVVLIKRSCPSPRAYWKLSSPLPRKSTLTARLSAPPTLGFLFVEVYGAPEKELTCGRVCPPIHTCTQTHTGKELVLTGQKARPGRPAGEELLSPQKSEPPTPSLANPMRGLLSVIRSASSHRLNHFLPQPAEGSRFLNT